MSSFQNLQTSGYLPYVIGGGVVATTAVIYFLRNSSKKKNLLVIAPKDTVVLRQIRRGPFAPSPSPFCVKLETYLRMAKIPYKTVIGWQNSPKTGKTPWVQLNGEVLSDTQLIMEHLNKHFNINTTGHLTPTEIATARAFVKMLEDGTYWYIMRWRMIDPKFLKEVMKISGIVFHLAVFSFGRTIYGQGAGRYQPEELYHLFRGDMKALSTYLGEKNFFMGEKPCEVDCGIFGMLSQVMWNAPNSSILDIMNEFPNLPAYCHRMKETYWPDWDDCIAQGIGESAEYYTYN